MTFKQHKNSLFVKNRIGINYLNFKHLFWVLLFFSTFPCLAQTIQDTLKIERKWNFHYQSTVITQYHPAFQSSYSGMNSLDPTPETHTSVSGTLFFGARLWKGAEAYFNPELTGGAGFSQTTGVAGFPNGEVYRVSDANPHIYVARLYLKQVFPLSDKYEFREDDVNQIASMVPTSYFAASAGKFSMMDFFDNNCYSHDPRKQFFNWTLMGNGAWDYPANTRGYTYGIVLEFVKPIFAVRFSTVMVPTAANGSTMDHDILHARSDAFEFEHKYSLGNQTGTIRWMTYLTHARMGNYNEAMTWGKNHHTSPAIDSVRTTGRTKFGFGVNLEQPLSKSIGIFLRASWNDGKNETWAFTEIDHHLSAGLVVNGAFWKRKDDNLGFALIVNGISTEHRNYLKAGGYGFIIGDGNLNYGNEYISEIYYSFKFLLNGLFLTPNYQFIANPANNKDRGPVNAFGVRLHYEI
ncbi:MAG: carbohydrate porin [Bacteroidia bacterium]|nr:carbohydrate porin [Bacteroidia bacterium]